MCEKLCTENVRSINVHSNTNTHTHRHTHTNMHTHGHAHTHTVFRRICARNSPQSTTGCLACRPIWN